MLALSTTFGGGHCRAAAGASSLLGLSCVHHILKLTVLLMAKLLEVIFLLFIVVFVIILTFIDIIVIRCEGHFVVISIFSSFRRLLVFI